MTDDEYCENCSGECDGCCGGSNKKFTTEKEQSENIVRMIMSYGFSMANLVLNELNKQITDVSLTKDKK